MPIVSSSSHAQLPVSHVATPSFVPTSPPMQLRSKSVVGRQAVVDSRPKDVIDVDALPDYSSFSGSSSGKKRRQTTVHSKTPSVNKTNASKGRLGSPGALLKDACTRCIDQHKKCRLVTKTSGLKRGQKAACYECAKASKNCNAAKKGKKGTPPATIDSSEEEESGDDSDLIVIDNGRAEVEGGDGVEDTVLSMSDNDNEVVDDNEDSVKVRRNCSYEL